MGDGENPNPQAQEERLERIFEKIETHFAGAIPPSLDARGLEREGVLSAEEVALLLAGKFDCEDSAYDDTPVGELQRLLHKVVSFQFSLAEDRPVPIEELVSTGVFTSADLDFIAKNGVKYKPHKRTDLDAGDMFHMRTDDGGFVLIGPSGGGTIKF